MKGMLALALLISSWAQAADYSISSGTSTFDCDTACGGGACSAGDNLILDAGNRGPITFQDCDQGTDVSPITIKNSSSGQTVIQSSGIWPMRFNNVDDLVIDGTGAYTGKGVGEGCGAQYVDILTFRTFPSTAVADQKCGIKIECGSSSDVNAFIKFKGGNPVMQDIVIKGVEIDGGYEADGTGCESSPPGIGIDTADNAEDLSANPGEWYENITISDNFVHNTSSECLYIGSNVNTPRDIPTRNVTIANNVMYECGYDALDLKTNIDDSTGRSQVYGNYVAVTAVAPGGGAVGNNGGGIYIFEGGFVDVYNNWVQDTSPSGDGTGTCYVQFIQKLVTDDATAVYAVDDLTVSWWNNVCVDPKGGGINVGIRGIANQSMPQPTMFNNTIVGVGGVGINIDGDVTNAGTIQDNIVCDSGSSEISGGGGADVISSNQTAACSSQGFSILVARDFHLSSESAPAYNDGVYASPPSDDFDGVSRPQSTSSDDGAFEYNGPPSEPAAQRGEFKRPSVVQ